MFVLGGLFQNRPPEGARCGDFDSPLARRGAGRRRTLRHLERNPHPERARPEQFNFFLLPLGQIYPVGAVRLLGSGQASAACRRVTLNLPSPQFPPLPNGNINTRLSGFDVLCKCPSPQQVVLIFTLLSLRGL